MHNTGKSRTLCFGQLFCAYLVRFSGHVGVICKELMSEALRHWPFQCTPLQKDVLGKCIINFWVMQLHQKLPDSQSAGLRGCVTVLSRIHFLRLVGDHLKLIGLSEVSRRVVHAFTVHWEYFLNRYGLRR